MTPSSALETVLVDELVRGGVRDVVLCPGSRSAPLAYAVLAADRAGVTPEECLLVDDLAANCEGAAAAGWQAVHFTDTAAAIERLELLPFSVRSGK